MTHWEYWPMEIVNIPVVFFWLFYAIRARDLFFFSNTNPAIENGGVLGESKWNIYQHMPGQILPRMFSLDADELTASIVRETMSQHQINFPIVIKPDIGERGYWVEKIHDQDSLKKYLRNVPKVKLIFQEYIPYPVELSIMYHRFPGNNQGNITSLCIKEMLTVTGDGKSTLTQLIKQYPRAKLQWKTLSLRWQKDLGIILPAGKSMELIPIGNHCRGAKFCNGNQHIDSRLTAVFDTISLQTKELYYGRFDLRCRSIESLKQGNGFTILEYNGVASEPAHIYQPGYSILQAYRDIFRHWGIIYRLHKSLKTSGYKTMSWREAKDYLLKYRRYKRLQLTDHG